MRTKKSPHCSLKIEYPTTNTLAIIGAICGCAKTTCEGQAFIKRPKERYERVTIQQMHSVVGCVAMMIIVHNDTPA